jgi:hypothetical protein
LIVFGGEFGAAGVDVAQQLGVGVVGDLEDVQESAAALFDVVEGLLGGGDPLGVFAAFGLLELFEGGG